MGLLYVDGVRFHDDDAELIEGLRRGEKRSRQMKAQLADDGEIYADVFDPMTGRSLASQVRAAAKARRESEGQGN